MLGHRVQRVAAHEAKPLERVKLANDRWYVRKARIAGEVELPKLSELPHGGGQV